MMHHFYKKNFLRGSILLFTISILLISSSTSAQTFTFSETFDDTPTGEVPENWKWYSLGGTHGNNWVRSTYGFFGPKVMSSGAEYAFPGQVDEDWLVTPQITPVNGDYLIFDSGQEFVWDDWGSTFEILISTKSASRSDFTNVLASYTETEFPGYLYEERITLDLSAYVGKPIYIAFVHKNPVSDEAGEMPPVENWYLDNVAVRALQPLDYAGAEIHGSYKSVIRIVQSKTSVIVGFIVRAAGDNGEANITSMRFTTANTSPLVKIKEATVYITYDQSFIATDDENGIVWADVYGTVENPGDEFIVEGDKPLSRGDTFFWLMYTLEADEHDLRYPYPEADATFESVVVNGVEHATTVPSTDGAHAVVPHTPPNDFYANAEDITLDKNRYGSYTYKATFESELEKLAYCATPVNGTAMDGSNSVWWRFKAPGDGRITVDLSASDFNTLLLIQDDNYYQLACNKDIDGNAFIFQSKITDFDVRANQEYYIRVSGEGLYPGDPNTANGVVHMDFSFSFPLSNEGNLEDDLSALYPNPTTGLVYVDLSLKRPTHVTFDIIDFMGRPVATQDLGFYTTGKVERIPVNLQSLPNGTYMVRLREAQHDQPKKLVIFNK
ncbi:T9SS-dependent choice-of-anchor J family protein [Pseudochryseolinea flava]|uniref:Secretion system C-terminal sorting domain-containing protein n=1 Tax=Pseudochryseolinea flava TaxID=2059302 RepID=A0A364Y1E1_9BACT|nr:choice-of-anchor J domain-containing protein [Pseudochryseolinea flava]RAW00524.1 hypothetical protein DQQ10_13065 [Pseudochryseolinea flava]